jgi:hypothetical protein
MIIGRIRDSNFVYRAPEGVDNCSDLHVRVTHEDGVRVMTSAWMPTPEELARLNAGEPIHLHIYGAGHPVVALSVANDGLG